MSAMASQITDVSIVSLIVCIQAQFKENIKAPRQWHLWGESTGDWWIALAKDAENVSIWWRHHDAKPSSRNLNSSFNCPTLVENRLDIYKHSL